MSDSHDVTFRRWACTDFCPADDPCELCERAYEIARLRGIIIEWHESQAGGGVRHLRAGNALHQESRRSVKAKSFARYILVTTDELEARRGEIISALDMTLEEFHQRHESGVMTPEEWDTWDELWRIDNLLGR